VRFDLAKGQHGFPGVNDQRLQQGLDCGANQANDEFGHLLLPDLVAPQANLAGGATQVLRASANHWPLTLRPAFGASSFSFSSASGIILPNIELNIAVGIRPALPDSGPCPPDIRNCGTSG